MDRIRICLELSGGSAVLHREFLKNEEKLDTCYLRKYLVKLLLNYFFSIIHTNNLVYMYK